MSIGGRCRALNTLVRMQREARSSDDRRAEAVPRFEVTVARKKALQSAGAKSRRVAPTRRP
jgi:hypothetical protein